MANPVDPNASLVDAKLPVALLPVRLETRFTQDQGKSWLLIRVFPDDVHIDRRRATVPARARLLPEAWIALGYGDAPGVAAQTPGGAVFAVVGNPIRQDLAIAPDPSAPHHDPFDDGTRWLADFADAEQHGMALRVQLDPATAQAGLARLLVVGVRHGDDAAALADLLTAHRQSDGLGLVPVGTPSNNTPDAPSGWSSEASPPGARSVAGGDGALAEAALGLPAGTIATAPNGDRRQVDAARRMNTLLWRPTWGYFLETMFAAAGSQEPPLTADALTWVRDHFIRHVRADGPLPTVRVGRQPYGLLPVTSLAAWPSGDRSERLATLLRSVRDRLFRNAARALIALQPGQAELDRAVGDLLAQQAHSWRYFTRSLLGAQYLRTLLGLMRFPPSPARSEPALPFFDRPPLPDNEDVVNWHLTGSSASPASLPWTGDEQLWQGAMIASERTATQLLHDVQSDLGVSWRPRLGRGTFLDAVVPIASLVVDGSYLATLAQAATTFASLRGEARAALLDQLARHAVLLEGAAAAGRASAEPELVNIVDSSALPSVWSVLGAGTVLAAASQPAGAALAEVREALGVLAALPPAELERLLGGTLDLASHRLDAWITSLAKRRLDDLRRTAPAGLHVGGYGWVVDLRPQASAPAPLAPDEHILTPSLDHAITAAILRAGYQAHRAAGESAMAVDLSSARVRVALELLDGVRQGQPLGALLGYRFERSLQERSRPGHPLGVFIAPCRRVAPPPRDLVPPPSATESIAAHDVVDGLALARIYKTNRDAGTPPPFGSTCTVEARVLVRALGEDFASIANLWTEGPDDTWLFGLMSDGRLAFAWHADGTASGTPGYNAAQSTSRVRVGVWTHVAVVRERGQISFYIDGRPDGDPRPLATTAPMRQGPLALRIGAQARGGVNRFLTGRVREVRLWSIAQAAGDVQRLAHGPLVSREAGLAGCWRFDEGSGASIADRSPYRRNGAFAGVGNPPWVMVSKDDDPLWGAGPALELGGAQFVEVAAAQHLNLGAVAGLSGDAGLIAALDELVDTVDAVGDLALAESVHQVVLGNPVRAGATLDALSRGQVPPPELEVTRTPQGGVSHAHRLLAVFSDGGAPHTWSSDPSRLRAAVEPLVNAWAAVLLGAPARVRYRCDYLDDKQAVLASQELGLDEAGLGLSALDVIYAAPGRGEPGSDELADRLRYQRMLHPPAVAWRAVRLDLGRQPGWPPDRLSVAELCEAAAGLRRLLDRARPLAGGGLQPTGELDIFDAADLAQRAARAASALQAAKAALSATDPAQQRAALLAASFAGVVGAVPRSVGTGDADRAALAAQLRAVSDEIDRRIERASAAADGYLHRTPPAPVDAELARLRALMGGGFCVVPRLGVPPAVRDALRAGFHVGAAAPWDDATLRPAAWSWLSRLARVRDGASRLDDVLLYDAALNGAAGALHVGQLPARSGEAWIGLTGPAAALPGGRVSLVACAPLGFDLDKLAGGLVVDEWVETVPRPTHTAGLAFRVDAPGAAPPQAILLAVPNNPQTPSWNLAALEAVLLETLELLRLRMVGPRDLGPAQQFLPASLLAYNPDGDTVSTNLVNG